MTIRNRELSQFGSFIYVENSTQEIGITTGALPYVGIGTTNPQYKLDVFGDGRFTGVVTATTFNGQVNATIGTITNFTATNLDSTALSIGGISTFGTGPVFIGAATSTGTISQPLQVSGGAYVSGDVGIGTTNPQYKLDINGDTNIVGVLTVGGSINATSFFVNGSPLVDATVDKWQSGTGSDIYRLNGNVGIGTSVITEKLTVSGNVSVSDNVSASRFISTVSTGTAPLTVTSTTEVTNLNASLLRGGVPGSNINTFDIVTNAGTQTLTNKTLTLPTFGGTGVTFTGSSSQSTNVRASATAGNNTLTLPTTTGTLICTGDTDVITSSMITNLSVTNDDVSTSAAIAYSKLSLTNSITNNDIAVGAAITNGKLANSSISGVSLGSSLNHLTAGSFINYSSGTTYNGSAAITVSVAATTANTGNTIVARDSSGDFTAGTVSVTNLTASQTVQAADFNSTSDENLKTNIETIENGLETIKSLRGVTFDWKSNQKPSIGVIAQELEKVLPELVTDGDPKTVNYNGLIGVLIEAVKELSAEIEDLKKSLNN